jgi:hypothetical protein
MLQAEVLWGGSRGTVAAKAAFMQHACAAASSRQCPAPTSQPPAADDHLPAAPCLQLAAQVSAQVKQEIEPALISKLYSKVSHAVKQSADQDLHPRATKFAAGMVVLFITFAVSIVVYLARLRMQAGGSGKGPFVVKDGRL